jgi:hypothetical protein
MGDPVDLRSYPIFKCEKIYYYNELPDFPYKVAVGREGGCSFYTKAILIETRDNLDNDTLDRLRAQLERLLSEQSG